MKPFLSRAHIARTGRVLALLAAACAMPAYATLFSNSAKLTSSDSATGDFAGYSVAVSADDQTLIFGAPNAKVNGVATAGKVYVFTHNTDGTWTQQAALTESGTPGPDFLGASVALSADGNTAVIGASSATVSGQAGAGKVYVFTRNGNTWSTQTSFSDPAPAASDQFGAHVALSGDAKTLLIGAPYVTVNSDATAGAVFAYTQTNGTWSTPAKLTATDAATKSYFGIVALSSDGNTALIGTGGAGKAYFFTRSNGTWSQSQELSDPGSGNDFFGSAVAISGDGKTAVVGAYYTTISFTPPAYGTNAGRAYVYAGDNGNWSLQQSIDNPSSLPFTGAFGNAVALTPDGNTALIAADKASVNGGPSIGQAFAFTRSGTVWTKVKEIDDPALAQYDTFGVSAALDSTGTTAFLGSFGASGAHYVYVVDSPADLSLALSADHSIVPPGQSLTYMLTATNNDAEVTATNVTVVNTLPANVTAANMTTGCTGTTGTVTCVVATLAPGATYQPSITITAPPNTTGQPFNITDNAALSADQADTDTANNNANLATIVTSSSGSNPPASSGSSGGGALGLLSLGLLGFFWKRRYQQPE
ncbi:MAG: hypothetical protein ACRESX_02375 [Gammaproteobacteria bacterium]